MERLAAPWNGVNLGGWLLLEPGPARPLFDVHLDGYGEEARCEWDLMRLLRARLGDAAAEAELRRHREVHVGRRRRGGAQLGETQQEVEPVSSPKSGGRVAWQSAEHA